jgi:hypothetical protein
MDASAVRTWAPNKQIFKAFLTSGGKFSHGKGNETIVDPISRLVENPGHVFAGEPHGGSEMGH